jgi:hypothetical protein
MILFLYPIYTDEQVTGWTPWATRPDTLAVACVPFSAEREIVGLGLAEEDCQHT